jgi:hypothetical protein
MSAEATLPRHVMFVSTAVQNLTAIMRTDFLHGFPLHCDRQDISNASLIFQCLHILMSIFLEMSLCAEYLPAITEGGGRN